MLLKPPELAKACVRDQLRPAVLVQEQECATVSTSWPPLRPLVSLNLCSAVFAELPKHFVQTSPNIAHQLCLLCKSNNKHFCLLSSFKVNASLLSSSWRKFAFIDRLNSLMRQPPPHSSFLCHLLIHVCVCVVLFRQS